MTLTPLQALSRAIASAVSGHDDVIDGIATLLSDAQESLGAAAGAMMISSTGGDLEVLVGTSHRRLDLMLYDAQRRQGPSAEAVTSNSTVVQGDGPALAERWPALADLMHTAGYHAIQAHPVGWHGQAVGALTFLHQNADLQPDDLLLGQAFADVATMLLAMNPQQVQAPFAVRIEAALKGRVSIERAKGVLAQQHQISGEDAYTALLDLARAQGTTLTATAAQLVQYAKRS